MKTFLIVDGNSILNRAFYGVRTLNNSSGLPTNAIYGMITMLNKQIEKYKPDYTAIAFDVHAPTFRHRLYDGYKATRKGMPQELAVQLPYAKKAAEVLGFHIIEREGYEADDILGSLARIANNASEQIISLIMTGDRDSLQLINDSTAILLATNSDYVYYDREAFVQKYSITPEQFVDLKAIMGDSSDNIPGIKGIGEKGAIALISEFGTLNELYNCYTKANLTPALIKKLEAGKESAFLSQTLAKIDCNISNLPLIENLINTGIDASEALKLFTELEFSALIKKFGLDSMTYDLPQNTVAGGVISKDDKSLTIKLLNSSQTSIIIHDNILYTYNGFEAAHSLFDYECACAISDNSVNLIAYDFKNIYKHADKYGIKVTTVKEDVMLAAYVIDSQGGHDLDRLVQKYLGETFSENINKAFYVYELQKVLSEKLSESNNLQLYRDIELPLSIVLADMEETGFMIDKDGISLYGDKLQAEADSLSQRIYFQASEQFNINSPKQLGEILFEKLNLPSGKKTKTGYSTSAEVLQKLSVKYPIVSDILEYRQLTKLIGTYVTGLLKVADDNGRIHTNFKQTGTATGRLSSSEPNLQNIPVRTEVGRELRKYFIPKDNYKLIAADYSQIELRLLACISNDEKMLSDFLSGEDIHASTASTVFGVPINMVTPILRKRAKAVNFGIVYGIGEFSLSQDLNISVIEAKEYIENYLSSYPGVKSYLKDIVNKAKKYGYVETIYGRKRFIPEIQSNNGVMRKFGERVAMNSPIQGSAADIIKIAMLNVWKKYKEKNIDAKIILQVHDELIIEAHESCHVEAANILKQEMENAVNLQIPLNVDLSIGNRWYET